MITKENFLGWGRRAVTVAAVVGSITFGGEKEGKAQNDPITQCCPPPTVLIEIGMDGDPYHRYECTAVPDYCVTDPVHDPDGDRIPNILPETADGIDNDCDGQIDEGILFDYSSIKPSPKPTKLPPVPPLY